MSLTQLKNQDFNCPESKPNADNHSGTHPDSTELFDKGDRASDDVEMAAEMIALSELQGRTIIEARNNEAALNRKLAEIALFTSNDKSIPHLPFRESLSIQLPIELPLSDKLAVDDLEREKRIASLTTEAVHNGLDKLREEQVKFRRPNDYFAEMVKSDEQMGKIKRRIINQKDRIESVQTLRNNRDLKKNRKKVRQEQIEKEQAKKQIANEEIATLSRLRKSRLVQREVGETNGSDNEDDDFPIDMIEVEQLDSSKKFPNHVDIAGGKKTPKGRVDARSDEKSRHFEKNSNGKPRLGSTRGIYKNGKAGKKKRLGKSRRKALKSH